jgi:hypothetical protein
MPGYVGVNLPARSIETQEKKEEPVPETHIKTTRARRGQATDPHSIAERVRWELRSTVQFYYYGEPEV